MTSSFDKSVKMWDARASLSTPVFVNDDSHSGVVMTAFSSDDTKLLSSSVRNEVRLLHPGDGRTIHNYVLPQAHRPLTYRRSYFLHNSDWFVTCSCEGRTMQLLSTATGKLVADFDFGTVALKQQQSSGQVYRERVCVSSPPAIFTHSVAGKGID